MPDALPGPGVDGDERIREQVVAQAAGAVEIRCRGAGRREQDAALLVKGHTCPDVGAAGLLQGTRGPGFRTRIARLGNGVKLPYQAAVDGAERPNRTRKGVRVLGGRKAEYQLVFENNAWRGHGEIAGSLHLPRRDVEASLLAEGLDGLAIGCVQGDQHLAGIVENAPVVATLPVHQAALGAAQFRVEAPKLLAGGGVQRKRDELRRQAVENAVYDERACIHRAGRLAGAVHPCLGEPFDVVPRDLGERRIVLAAGIAEIGGPIHVPFSCRRLGRRSAGVNEYDQGRQDDPAHVVHVISPQLLRP